MDVYSIHAEMNVVRFAQPGDKLVVYRFNAKGEARMSRPCSACQKFIKAAGISHVEYSNWDGEMEVLELD